MRNKTFQFYFSVLLLGAVWLLHSSVAPLNDYDYMGEYVPIFMERSDLEKSVAYREARELINPGKIYYRSPYLFVNERYKGVHVINNSDPRHPVNEGFITAPGCIDMAVQNTILYLDNAIDLVAFDLLKKQEVSRVTDVFPEPLSPDNLYRPASDRPAGLIIVEWKKRETAR